MNKSPHYNQQKEPKQYKSEIEKIYSPKHGDCTSQDLYRKNVLDAMLERIPLKNFI